MHPAIASFLVEVGSDGPVEIFVEGRIRHPTIKGEHLPLGEVSTVPAQFAQLLFRAALGIDAPMGAFSPTNPKLTVRFMSAKEAAAIPA